MPNARFRKRRATTNREDWSRGGETRLANLILSRAYHHMLVHEGGWTLTGTPGHLDITRPDKTRLGNRVFRLEWGVRVG